MPTPSTVSPSSPSPTDDVRRRILKTAAKLLAEHGREALTTRAVVVAAGVQQPTLYRLFGDKNGLLDAVADHCLAAYVAEKAAAATLPDALADFRVGWDRHVEFGLSHPALFAIIWGDPDPARTSPAAAAGQIALQRKIHALAASGLLRISEARATSLAHATCTGVVLTLLDTPEGQRDLELATMAREAVIATISFAAPVVSQPGPVNAAITLRAVQKQTGVLTPGEHHLLGELLDRIARGEGF